MPIIWTDGESEIRHIARCKCGFCKIEKSIETSVKVKCGWLRGNRAGLVTGLVSKNN